MRINKIKTAVAAVAFGAVAFTGCSKFLDINVDPNNPADVNPRLLLPSTEAAIAMTLGNNFHQFGSIWGQYNTQNPTSSQYKTVDQYLSQQTAFNTPWSMLYKDAMTDLQRIISKAQADAFYKNHAAVAYLMLAYETQMITDAWGDAPLSEAIKGTINTSPKYDSQKAIYDSIFAYIDRGAAMIDLSSTAGKPGTEDLIFQGAMDKWVLFANTLKLRAALRLSNQPEAAQTVATQMASLKGKAFLTADAKINYIATGGNGNPFYEEQVGLKKVQNMVASKTVVDQFVTYSDPRLAVFYTKRVDGSFFAIPQGSFATDPKVEISYPSAAVAGDANNTASGLAPVKLISATEAYFLQAEAVAKGFLDGNASTLFTQGIDASFAAYGVSTADATAYKTDAAVAKYPGTTVAENVKAIITQKYFAMCNNQSFEAWTEWRRTGYPTFFVGSVAGKTNLNGNFPARFKYPDTEVLRNPNTPKGVELDARVWWDVADNKIP
ncbi:SusD-like starch-binding protein associating with outer membrane [Chitinophaga skermanii]|uniref:SusD-like starch-binding protein associating with outer membrane n=1 Tax=Chitinophaga skermanii TaxID=331697 RepID=A0A327QIV5_9BACT|nr:SusD/RagB family nutrient-binding outer membrane lipoprotein [Chitinophaga skermanii]RAJ03925.1 SusD-like starch-binding protein associating with outer membrane [Chitinophaga skermanii]